MFILPMLFMIVIFGVIAYYSKKHDDKVSREWRIWSHARDWIYHPTWPQVVNRFDGGPFQRGRNRKADRGFEGTFNGVPAIGFRYTHVTGSGKNSTTHRCVVLAVRLEHARMPHLVIRRGGWLRKGLSFEHGAFNEDWYVDCGSPRFAYDFVNPRVIDMLLSPHPPFEEMWVSRDHLFLKLSAGTTLDQMDAYLILLTRTLSYLPDFLFREVGSRPPALTDVGPGVSWQDQQRRIAMMNSSVAKS